MPNTSLYLALLAITSFQRDKYLKQIDKPFHRDKTKPNLPDKTNERLKPHHQITFSLHCYHTAAPPARLTGELNAKKTY